ncbi:MAG: hypothetical protein ACPG21_02815 [Crocinitomicaceae bacterium]
MKSYLLPLLLFGVMLISSCTASRFVEPLDKDEISIGASFGGPIIDFGGPLPMPITSVEVGYGLDSSLTVFGGWHTTAAIFGNAQIDLGCSYQFLEQDRFIPNLSVSPSINMIYDFGDRNGNIWPVLDINAFWNYGQRSSYFYAGFNNYFELNSTGANDQPQDRYWLFSPQIGHVLKGKNGRGQLTTEFKFFGPYIENSYAFVPFMPITGNGGARGFFIGYRWTINKN